MRKHTSKALSALLVAFFAARAAESQAGGCLRLREQVSGQFDKVPEKAEVFLDSAVEVETEMRDEVMAMLTTVDGTIGPLINHATQKFPQAVVDIAIKKGLTAETVDKLAWDDLSIAQKLNLLQEVSKTRGAKFFEDRAIRGIRMRPVLTLTFDKPTTFLGVDYQPGSHLVNLSRFLGGKVEYIGPHDVETVGGIEFHFRGPESAGTMSADLRVLQRALDLPTTHQHVHLVGKIWAGDKTVISGAIGDHFRRSNLVAEMQAIVEEGGSIDRIAQEGTAVYFDSLSQTNLVGVMDYLEAAVGNPNPPKIGDKFKMGYVGFRGVDKYDQGGLIGYEYRAIDADVNNESISANLDAMQHFLTRGNSKGSWDHYYKWAAHWKGYKPRDFIAWQWYNRPWTDLLQSGPPEVMKLVDGKFREWLETKDQTKNQEIKMLFHSWKSDSMLFANPENYQAVLAKQIEAVNALKAGGEPNEIVRKFLVDSKLYVLFRKSLAGT